MPSSFVIPFSIVITLGILSGIVWHAKVNRYWIASASAALTAGAVWTIGCGLFLQFVAPAERFTGVADAPYAGAAFAVTSLVALAPALAVGLVTRRLSRPRQNTH